MNDVHLVSRQFARQTRSGALAIVTILIAVVAGNPVPAVAQSLREDLDAFLKAYNTADILAIAHFVATRFEERVDAAAEARRWRRWYDVLGPLRYVATTDSTDSRLQVFVQGTLTRGWAELVVRPSRSGDGRIRGIALGMGLHPGLRHVPTPAPHRHELPRLLHEYLSAIFAADYFSGTILVARNGRMIFHESAGWEDRGARTPITAATRFDVGSVTKLFTATAVLKLVQAGRLSLDNHVAPILPDAPMELHPDLTVRHLLTHTGGLGRGAFDQSATYPRELMSVDDLLALTVAPPEFAPGEDVRYSNTGFMVLGKVIEKISGENYFDFVTREIFFSAGMRSSGFLELDRDPANVAKGYTRLRALPGGAVTYEWGPRHNTRFMDPVRGSPAGGSYHTALDLLSYMEALRKGTLLDADRMALLLDGHVEIPIEPGTAQTERYGFGWREVTLDGKRYFVRDGASNGISARMDYYPDQGYQVVVLANVESMANLVANHVAELLLRMQ